MNLPSEDQSLVELPKVPTDFLKSFRERNLDRHVDVIVHEELALVVVELVTTEIAVDDGNFLLLFDFEAMFNSSLEKP